MDVSPSSYLVGGFQPHTARRKAVDQHNGHHFTCSTQMWKYANTLLILLVEVVTQFILQDIELMCLIFDVVGVG